MARMSRLAVAGHPHHLFQRGNDRIALFRDDADRERYLDCLREAASTAKTCRAHGLATPAGTEGLSRMMQALGRNYVGWFNHRHQRSGTLWEGRFRSGLIEAETWLLRCMRYIELNPLRAGIAAEAGAFRWSSARHHLGQATDALLTDHALFWSLGNTPFEREAAWREFLGQPVLVAEAQQITASCLRGWALGSTGFLERMDGVAGRRLVPAKRGRPRKH